MQIISEPGVGVGPWPGGRENWPTAEHYDLELLENGDRRNVEDHFRYWKMEAIVAELNAVKERGKWLEVAIENLGHDFNIGSIVRTANAMGVRHVHIVGRRRWNRRGAMVTDRYMQVHHHPDVESFQAAMQEAGMRIVGVDNIERSVPLEETVLPLNCVMVMGEESTGLSPEMAAISEEIVHITQYGSTRSMNVGHAAAISMWAWVLQHRA
ncbi:RNA methyltransferase, TrmH family [Gleimia coleocanis DSM 15436]|uniref:RNA methyltransferase, TrmH family n=1 Tax=Gleimia coleocanis DSM 15436 TaxID=525245 RepID=C0VYE9_9ACTO|nr:RNA methyltransferase [Gleimia coleocanis]EEH64452.1 RNA methyltransferase, TrmH family [Gleimia coleocanis DSM 15436]